VQFYALLSCRSGVDFPLVPTLTNINNKQEIARNKGRLTEACKDNQFKKKRNNPQVSKLNFN
jgi:hypothetical protein